MASEYTCPNCDSEYEIDDNGDPIQKCPNCGSLEMVKNAESNKK